MAQLIVLGVADRDTAEKALDTASDLNKQELLQLEDAAYAYKDDKGRPRIHQTVNLTGHGAAGGALWGTLIGLLFLNPLLGLAVGAGAGAIAGRLSDVGIDDDVIKDIGAQLQQGRAAVFLLAADATIDRVVDAFRPLDPTVIQTNLSKDSERELVEALQAQ
ncbi:DUF1269 domain-containing protein [Nocardiopsis sp. L17-MgMaSL7]|uniref:DUF1269 domain-containing protein n=1 Tax=Nocardiopsis sp. L17-MgMaSL7 TaxID=1938893 RepID=UPI000D712DD5|nr:DUF1269 domain-containing protein [Nocardiopsis sp. L17-MgMaSL7]PWV50253.1 putative membrane protein [Nocardiopsis sp. L17-MgMaSL7]